ncbi:MAG: 5-oxoprolinase subunit PxpA [Acidobacteriota bacterium]
MKVDLNADYGESYGNLKVGEDERILNFVTSINIGCGFHGGDPTTMRKIVQLAKIHNVSIGAHPSFPDLMGFGRREMKIEEFDLENILIYQIGALEAMVEIEGMEIQHVKPHGALYNMAVKDKELARIISRAIKKINKNYMLVALANSQFAKTAEDEGCRVAYEAFLDRRYNSKGELVPRTVKGSLIENREEILNQLERMVLYQKIKTVEGGEIPIKFHTLSLHSDTPGAVELIQSAREKLDKLGVEVCPLSQIILL